MWSCGRGSVFRGWNPKGPGAEAGNPEEFKVHVVPSARRGINAIASEMGSVHTSGLMNWYYAQDDSQVGPVGQAQFDSLVHTGAISAETQVWHDGLPAWTRYGDLAPMSATMPVSAGSHRCAECGNTFPDADMIAFESAWVCAACKPVFVQKLKEGIAPATVMQYAGFWIRFCARIIDGIIFQVINFGLRLIIMPSMLTTGRPYHRGAPMLTGPYYRMLFIFWLCTLGIEILYNVYFNGRFGATPGKMVLKLKIVRQDGTPISYLLAFGRYFAVVLSFFTLCIGFMMAGWDEEKRALHDRICDTRVIRV